MLARASDSPELHRQIGLLQQQSQDQASRVERLQQELQDARYQLHEEKLNSTVAQVRWIAVGGVGAALHSRPRTLLTLYVAVLVATPGFVCVQERLGVRASTADELQQKVAKLEVQKETADAKIQELTISLHTYKTKVESLQEYKASTADHVAAMKGQETATYVWHSCGGAVVVHSDDPRAWHGVYDQRGGASQGHRANRGSEREAATGMAEHLVATPCPLSRVR